MSNKQTLIADSTQIGCFLECPEKWYLSHIQNLTRFDINAASKVSMHKGSYGHKLQEIYYKARTNPILAPHAIEYAVDWVPESESCACGHLKLRHLDSLTSCQSKDCYCPNFVPAPYPLEQEQIEEVQDRFRIYCYTYEGRGNDIVPLDIDSVEVGFSHELYEDENYLFVLEGKIDLIGKIQKQTVIMDHKWQDRQRALYTKSLQFKNYCLVTECDTLIVNYIRMADKITDETFVRAICSFSRQDLKVWENNVIDIFARMCKFKKQKEVGIDQESDYNWRLCEGRFGYQCEFTQLCEQNFIPVKDIMKKTQYKQKQEWRPW